MNLKDISKVFVEQKLLNIKAYTTQGVKFEKLKGDASSRNYFRLSFENESSLILCYDPNFEDENSDFIKLNKLFKEFGIFVPNLYEFDYQNKLILQEDLGNKFISFYKSLGNYEYEIDIYKQAIHELVKIQTINLDEIKNESYGQRFFDESKLLSEVNITSSNISNYFLKDCADISFVEEIQDFFKVILKDIFTLRECLVHRDYHSRNILIHNSQEYLIDYQDARVGQFCYDLVSLLEDPYNQLDNNVKEDAKNYYLKELKKIKKLDYDNETFLSFYQLMSLQRLYKALGTYLKMLNEKNNNSYMIYVGRTIEQISEVCRKDKKFSKLSKLALRYYYDC